MDENMISSKPSMATTARHTLVIGPEEALCLHSVNEHKS